jgi:hypothetical protein
MTDNNGMGGGRSNDINNHNLHNNNNNNNNNDNNNEAPSNLSMSPQDSIEQAFGLLKEAKSMEGKEEYWKAAEIYIQAQQLLQALADDTSRTVAVTTTTSDDNNNNNNDTSSSQQTEEQEQIARLYRDKAQEYWSKSRYCLIQAMQQEKTIDEQQEISANHHPTMMTVAPSMTCNLIDDHQAKCRNQTFTALFSRPILEDIHPVAKQRHNNDDNKDNHDSKNILDQQWSIEERLHALNQSLPSGFKTDQERMSEINKGLNKLGLSLYEPKQPFARFQEYHGFKPPQSEEEQIEEIMAQARDEVALKTKNSTGKKDGVAVEEEYNDDDDDDDDDTSEEDDNDHRNENNVESLLDDDQLLAIKKIRKKVVQAQIKIAELVALLDEAKIARETEYKDNVVVPENDDDLAKSDALFLLGKKKLQSAQRDLHKALREWDDTLLVGTQNLHHNSHVNFFFGGGD